MTSHTRDTYGRALFEDIQKQPNPFAKKGTSERIATLLSLLIIGFSLAGLVAGVYGLIKWNNSPLIIFICVLILLISWLSRPRPNRLSKQVMSLAAASHPQIHKIFNHIAKEMGIDQPIQYALSPNFEAYITEIGWRRTPVVVIGYPLFFACTAEEMTALVAHELAHCRNRDIRRSGWVAHACRILINWSDMLNPDKHENESGLLHLITNGIMRILFWIPYSLLYLLIHLFWNQSQRAEYEADRIAAQLAGSDAMISMLQTVHLDHVYKMVVGKLTLQKQNANMWERLLDTFSSVPEKEKTRILRILEKSDMSLDTTHPSTFLRIAMIRQDPHRPLYQISKEDYERMCSEINTPAIEKMEHRIIETYRAQYLSG
ncbi:M48 family metalloprotease [Brevibacillus composti]|uniref:M48 family metalloprotease n=1 Tax=Brevibacillus composti TaxID=2796470 RepID=A0A7T5EPG5_9BACL|nr:M48 family metallopeptidase [Brevibacillus composti]QQE76341.1 M48 family metalloprotease [Brevibacillus composti]QUO43368.1 M48 family metalloprotease [Brevibacillus composti]